MQTPTSRDFADLHPNTQVIGTDISATLPTYVPENLQFEIDDFTQDWTFPKESFDFIHMRSLYGCVADWPAHYNKCLKYALIIRFSDTRAWPN